MLLSPITGLSQDDNVFRVAKVITSFKSKLGHRAVKLYENDALIKIDGLPEQIRTWYRVPREEYIIAAYNDIKSPDIKTDLYHYNSFQEGIVFTEKSFYVRRSNGSDVWNANYRACNQVCKFEWTDNTVFLKDGNKKRIIPVEDSKIKPFEMYALVNDVIYSVTEAKVEEKAKVNAIKKKSASEDLQKATALYNSRKFKESFPIFYRNRNSNFFTIEAKNKLGVLYGNYHDSDKSINSSEEALKWFTKAAEQGSVDATTNIGILYFFNSSLTGYNDDVSYGKALSWFKLAAEKGSVTAHWMIAVMYYDGYGVGIDKAEALKWLHKGAELPYGFYKDNIQYLLGYMYYNGEGMFWGSKSEALKWFVKAKGLDEGYSYPLEEMYNESRINIFGLVSWENDKKVEISKIFMD